MGFLRRILGGGEPAKGADAGPAPRSDAAQGAGPVADEQARDRELLLEDARRLDDDLIQRQLRFSDRSWTPPPQGGSRRADDTESDGDDPAPPPGA
jgi:hypothetical protein